MILDIVNVLVSLILKISIFGGCLIFKVASFGGYGLGVFNTHPFGFTHLKFGETSLAKKCEENEII